MLIIVDSRFRIPPSVTVRFKDQAFKILVSMDEYSDLEVDEIDVNEEEGSKDGEKMLTDEGDWKKFDPKEGKTMMTTAKEGEIEEPLHEDYVDLGARTDNEPRAEEFSLKLSEHEMMGIDVETYDNRLICASANNELMLEAIRGVIEINNHSLSMEGKTRVESPRNEHTCLDTYEEPGRVVGGGDGNLNSFNGPLSEIGTCISNGSVGMEIQKMRQVKFLPNVFPSKQSRQSKRRNRK